MSLPRARTLLLLRHAKSSWDDPDLDDFDRPLAARGRRDAPRIGAWLKEQGLVPDLVLCSPAARTRETWAAVLAEVAAESPRGGPPAGSGGPAPALGARPPFQRGTAVRFPVGLYHGSPGHILDLVRELPDDATTVMVVGHNPGLAETMRWLARRSATGAGRGTAGGSQEAAPGEPASHAERRRLREKVPTAAVGVFRVEGSWRGVGPDAARLERFVRPKDLR